VPGPIEGFIPFPTSFRRYLHGAFVCGLTAFAVCAMFGDAFYAMPVEVGSLPSDLLLFVVGVVAMSNQWLAWPIEEQMDTSVWYLRMGIILEAVGMLAFASFMSKGIVVQLFFYLVAGFRHVAGGPSAFPATPQSPNSHQPFVG
jgi:hypothetical protein